MNIWREMGLSDFEYAKILRLLEREPNITELGMFAVLWSEHCGYKHSRQLLKKLPTVGEAVLVGPGENAGVVDIGEETAVAFRIESHNHPSAIEPFQGAATGIGGIVRDVLAMGARPIALLDPLHFGELHQERDRYLLRGVVAGISAYGNCLGVPTVGGELHFAPSYAGNPLVNVMCVGLLPKARLTVAVAAGEGNLVYLLGSATGRDGIHGATFASAVLDERAEEKRPSVQVGDPFLEKLLIEACLELVEEGCLVGMQDLGAAGLTSSTAEMAAKGGVGIELDLDRVPRREPGMTPYDLMLSESQERMLVVVAPEKAPRVEEICRRWGVDASKVGVVTGDGFLRVLEGGRVAAQIPAKLLTEEAPSYVPASPPPPAYLAELAAKDPLAHLEDLADYTSVLRELLGIPGLCSPGWVTSQYDYQVGTNTVYGPAQADAAVLRIKGTGKAIAVATDGRGMTTYLAPRMGGALALAEAARKVTVTGGKPLGLTNCLNFGNPQDPVAFWQFREAVEGLGEAARALGIPVTGGNVSFYNERDGVPVYPTPVVGVVGLIEELSQITPMAFQREGDLLLLLGGTGGKDLGGSAYLYHRTGVIGGKMPPLDLGAEKRIQALCQALIRGGLVTAAHDLAEGGLALALAEMAISSGLGACVDLPTFGGRADALLFNESPSRILVTVRPEHLPVVEAMAEMEILGRVGAEVLELRLVGTPLVREKVALLREIWETGFGKVMDR